MNSSQYFDQCEYLLTHLCLRLQLRARFNLLNLHLHSENFFARLLNQLYGYQLVNLNAVRHNAAGVDLIDEVNKILVQVSGTATLAKLQKTLKKDLSRFAGYRVRFVAIVLDASSLATSTYENPNKLVFDPSSDILDITALLKVIMSMAPADQSAVQAIVVGELGGSDVPRSPTSLAEVIKVVATEPMTANRQRSVRLPFKISEKLTFNELDKSKRLVEAYSIFGGRIAGIYAAFDEAGKFRSTVILETFLLTYVKLSASLKGDALFFAIVEEMVAKVLGSLNHTGIPQDDLEFWMTVLAVDAFIRCKMFEPPASRPTRAVA